MRVVANKRLTNFSITKVDLKKPMDDAVGPQRARGVAVDPKNPVGLAVNLKNKVGVALDPKSPWALQ